MINKLFEHSKGSPLFLISGPCVIESEQLLMQVAEHMKRLTEDLGIRYVFKASYDKANRTSASGFRGPGREKGLALLAKVKEQFDLPILTDVHDPGEVNEVAEVADVLQIPAFLCRQTSLIEAAARSNRVVNIKKGQFLSPYDMQYAVEKAKSFADAPIWVCERGASFGYHNLVVDMRSLDIMKSTTSCPVVFDATHSVQEPGSQGGSTGGKRHFIPSLAKAAVATGIDGVFFETHPDPSKALSDGPNAWPLSQMRPLLKQLVEIDQLVKSHDSCLAEDI